MHFRYLRVTHGLFNAEEPRLTSASFREQEAEDKIQIIFRLSSAHLAPSNDSSRAAQNLRTAPARCYKRPLCLCAALFKRSLEIVWN